MNNTKPQYVKWSHLAIMIVVVIALILVFHQPIYGQLYDWNLVPKPETYTELYFTGTKTTPPTGQQYALSFDVHNVEYQTTNYTYVIEQLDTSDLVIAKLAEDHFTLDQDDKKDISVPATLVSSDKTAKVRITITFLEKDKHAPTSESIYCLTTAKGI